MKPDPVTEGQRWLSQAERDLEACSLLTQGGHFNLACFHAQQSAEKALKAFLISRGAREIRGHAVSGLAADAATLDSAFSGLKKHGALLDKYYIPTRYPNSLPGGLPAEAFGAEDAEMAIRIAQGILAFVSSRLAD